MERKKSPWVTTVRRIRIDGVRHYYAVMLDPYGRERCRSEDFKEESHAWEAAHIFFQNEPPDD